MKAYVLHEINKFQMEEVDCPQPKKNGVLVAVKAVGICGSDIPRIYTKGTYSYPLIPGHEFAGEVIGTGEETNPAWLGKRVGIFPLMPCFECKFCKEKKYEMCRKYNYLGSRTDGGFAEYVRVPEWNLIELPSKVTYKAAAMLEPMAVAVHAIRKAKSQKIDLQHSKIAICGMGTIGLFLLMFLLEEGIGDVYLIGNKDFQKNAIQQMGVNETQFCNARNQNPTEWLKERAGGVGVFFDCVGKNEVLQQAIESCNPGGMVVVVGNPESDVKLKRDIYWKILRNQLIILGTWNSSFCHENTDDWNYVLRLLNEVRITPEIMITHCYQFKELMKGFEVMREKKEPYIKVMTQLP